MSRKTRTENFPQFYGTKQVANILGVPEWRVKNFIEGEAYKLAASHQLGTGRGSRRVYTEANICRLGIALELVNCGFAPEAVGRAVREIPESILIPSENPAPSDECSILVGISGQWKVQSANRVETLIEKHLWFPNEAVKEGAFMLNIDGVLEPIFRSLRAAKEKYSTKAPESEGR